MDGLGRISGNADSESDSSASGVLFEEWIAGGHSTAVRELVLHLLDTIQAQNENEPGFL
jgi:hypothetical protein